MFFRIYIVHDEVKDKAFELELSWVGEGKNQSRDQIMDPDCSHGNTLLLLLLFSSVTNGRHQFVPKDVREEAEKYAKVSYTHLSLPTGCSKGSYSSGMILQGVVKSSIVQA